MKFESPSPIFQWWKKVAFCFERELINDFFILSKIVDPAAFTIQTKGNIEIEEGIYSIKEWSHERLFFDFLFLDERTPSLFIGCKPPY